MYCAAADSYVLKKIRELGAMGQLARVFPSDDPAISARTRQILEDFYKERGIPNPAELELLFKVGRAPLQRLKLWCKQIKPF